MLFLPFAGIAAALAAFLISTRQFQIPLRILIWTIGAFLLGAVIWKAMLAPNSHGFLQAATLYPYVLLDAFSGNWRSIGGVLQPLLDLLCLATLAVAATCLVALTPGEAIERFVRPIAIGLVGAILGASVALVMTGIGLGGLAKREVYVGVIGPDDVHDGDTILMGDVALRLWGMDAPELKQPCNVSIPSATCGDLARQMLASITVDELLVCTKHNDAAGPPRESFGRPLVRCVRQSDRADVGRMMVRNGCAKMFRDNGKIKSDYQKEEAEAGFPSINGPACPSFEQPEKWRRRQ